MYLMPAGREVAATLAPPPFPRVLCAVDGSGPAVEALRQAITLSQADAALTLMAVTDARGADRAEDAVQTALRTAHGAGMDARAMVSRGTDTAAAILAEAARHDLLVVGTHGHHRAPGYLLGATSTAAAHQSPVPVLIARAPAPAGFAFPRDILLATDGSPAMAATVATTAAIARRHRSRVALVHVERSSRAMRRELAEEATTLYEATGVEPVVIQVKGHVPERLAGIALDLRASLLVAGSRLLTGFPSLASVSERVGAIAPCSVLVVRRAT